MNQTQQSRLMASSVVEQSTPRELHREKEKDQHHRRFDH
jgi:hypothetical protein